MAKPSNLLPLITIIYFGRLSRLKQSRVGGHIFQIFLVYILGVPKSSKTEQYLERIGKVVRRQVPYIGLHKVKIPKLLTLWSQGMQSSLPRSHFCNATRHGNRSHCVICLLVLKYKFFSPFLQLSTLRLIASPRSFFFTLSLVDFMYIFLDKYCTWTEVKYLKLSH